MSSNRLTYDKCAYDQRLKESCGVLDHVMEESRFRNKKNCSFKSAKIDQFIGARVDIESQLRNLDKQTSLCSDNKFKGDKKEKKKEKKKETVNPYLCERELQYKKLPDGTVKCKK
jgi:hypothetical protein